jgi:hypothetical protein
MYVVVVVVVDFSFNCPSSLMDMWATHKLTVGYIIAPVTLNFPENSLSNYLTRQLCLTVAWSAPSTWSSFPQCSCTLYPPTVGSLTVG